MKDSGWYHHPLIGVQAGQVIARLGIAKTDDLEIGRILHLKLEIRNLRLDFTDLALVSRDLALVSRTSNS